MAVLVVEISQITVPVGCNFFVLKGLTGKSPFSIVAASLPLFLMLLAVFPIMTFSEVVTWIARQMSG